MTQVVQCMCNYLVRHFIWSDMILTRLQTMCRLCWTRQRTNSGKGDGESCWMWVPCARQLHRRSDELPTLPPSPSLSASQLCVLIAAVISQQALEAQFCSVVDAQPAAKVLMRFSFIDSTCCVLLNGAVGKLLMQSWHLFWQDPAAAEGSHQRHRWHHAGVAAATAGGPPVERLYLAAGAQPDGQACGVSPSRLLAQQLSVLCAIPQNMQSIECTVDSGPKCSGAFICDAVC